MNNGYVSVPREFFDSTQWRRKRIFTQSEAYLDLLQMAYYGSEPIEREVGGAKVTVRSGQIAATQAYLGQRWEWSRYKVRHFIDSLCNKGTIHLYNTPTCSLITVYQDVTKDDAEIYHTPYHTPTAHNKNKITKKKITKKSVESSVVCDTTPHAQAEGEVAEAEVSQVAEVAAVAEAATEAAAVEAVEAVEVAAEAKAASIKPAASEPAAEAQPASIMPAAEAKAVPAAAPKPATRRRTPPMQRPTVWEVENFCRTQGLQLVDAQRFVDYYEANGWKVGRNPMRSWQAAARNWQRRELQYQQPAAMAAINQTNLFTEPNCANNHEHSYAVQPAHDGAKLQQQQQSQQPLQQPLQQPQQPQLQQSQPRVFSYQSQPNLWQRQQCATKAGACAEALEQYAARQMRYFASMGAEEPDF